MSLYTNRLDADGTPTGLAEDTDAGGLAPTKAIVSTADVKQSTHIHGVKTSLCRARRAAHTSRRLVTFMELKHGGLCMMCVVPLPKIERIHRTRTLSPEQERALSCGLSWRNNVRAELDLAIRRPRASPIPLSDAVAGRA